MSNFSPYANYGYMAAIKESAAGTPAVPTEFVRYISESIVPNFNISAINEISGDRERNIRSVQNQIEIEGDVEFYVESKEIGHFLRSLFGAPTTQTLTAATAFRHTFEVSDTTQTYTFDFKPANSPWIHRFYGVLVKKMTIEPEDNKIKCTATLSPRKAFITARVLTAASSGTTLAVDQTSGLTTSDTILVLQKEDGYTQVHELTISSIDSETQLTTSTISSQIDVDDIVVIKASTESYDQDKVFTFLGGTEISTGDDIDNTSVVSREGFQLEYMNDTEPRWFGGVEEAARLPGDVLTKGFTATGQLMKFYDNQLNIDQMRKNEQSGVRVMMQGKTALEANSATNARTYWGTGNGFYVEAPTAGKAGNDMNVTIVVAADDNLAASISGNNILIQLANTTASKNTGTLIAAAVDALTGVDSAVEGTGAEQFTTAVNSTNLGDSVSGATAAVVGRDASEKPYLQFDHAAAKINAYFPSASEDNILNEEVPFTFYKDVESGQQKKNWSVKVRLVNSISSY